MVSKDNPSSATPTDTDFQKAVRYVQHLKELCQSKPSKTTESSGSAYNQLSKLALELCGAFEQVNAASEPVTSEGEGATLPTVVDQIPVSAPGLQQRSVANSVIPSIVLAPRRPKPNRPRETLHPGHPLFAPSRDLQEQSMSVKAETQQVFSATTEGQEVQASEDSRRCNCKKSQCLKLYCECFAAGVVCNGCACACCSNVAGNEVAIHQAKLAILARSPTAFDPKVQDHGVHKKGCRCRKSKCLKKYCECYQAGVPCTSSCRCEECLNCVHDQQPLPATISQRTGLQEATGTRAAGELESALSMQNATKQTRNPSGPCVLISQAGAQKSPRQEEKAEPSVLGGKGETPRESTDKTARQASFPQPLLAPAGLLPVFLSPAGMLLSPMNGVHNLVQLGGPVPANFLQNMMLGNGNFVQVALHPAGSRPGQWRLPGGPLNFMTGNHVMTSGATPRNDVDTQSLRDRQEETSAPAPEDSAKFTVAESCGPDLKNPAHEHPSCAPDVEGRQSDVVETDATAYQGSQDESDHRTESQSEITDTQTELDSEIKDDAMSPPAPAQKMWRREWCSSLKTAVAQLSEIQQQENGGENSDPNRGHDTGLLCKRRPWAGRTSSKKSKPTVDVRIGSWGVAKGHRSQRKRTFGMSAVKLGGVKGWSLTGDLHSRVTSTGQSRANNGSSLTQCSEEFHSPSYNPSKRSKSTTAGVARAFSKFPLALKTAARAVLGNSNTAGAVTTAARELLPAKLTPACYSDKENVHVGDDICNQEERDVIDALFNLNKAAYGCRKPMQASPPRLPSTDHAANEVWQVLRVKSKRM